MRPRTRHAAALAVVAALALELLGANPAMSQTPLLTAWAAGDPGTDPAAAIWEAIPALEVPLTAQSQTYPTGSLTVPTVRARAIVNRGVLYVRLDWDDATRDDATTRADGFTDAAALSLPADATVSVPSVCMGQLDMSVNVWQWRADGQADRQAAFAAAHPDQYVDLPSPIGEQSYTARTAGNLMAARGVGAVQDLVAVGFGTLGPATTQSITGSGVWSDGVWRVLFVRPLASPGADQPALKLHTQTDLALAVWNGSNGDRAGKKQISQFVRLDLSNAAYPPVRVAQQSGPTVIWVLALAPFAAILGILTVTGLRALRPRA